MGRYQDIGRLPLEEMRGTEPPQPSQSMSQALAALSQRTLDLTAADLRRELAEPSSPPQRGDGRERNRWGDLVGQWRSCRM